MLWKKNILCLSNKDEAEVHYAFFLYLLSRTARIIIRHTDRAQRLGRAQTPTLLFLIV